MFPIDVPTAVAVQPARRVAGTPGFFSNGDPLALPPLACTNLDQDFFNIVQQEICNAITLRGIALDKTDETQLYQAIKRGSLINVRQFAVGTSIPVFNSATRLLRITLVGGAGSSGGMSGTPLNPSCLGGASGAGGCVWFGPVGTFSGLTLVVGAAGTPGANTGTNGGDGADSTYGPLTAPHGKGSPGSTAVGGAANLNGVGAGRSSGGSGGTIANVAGSGGNPGFNANIVQPGPSAGGTGGMSAFGLGMGGDGVNNAAGPTAGVPGTGGTCIIEEFG